MGKYKERQFNKIFQIGFNRCGTKSFYDLFENLTNPKIPSVHWDSGNLGKVIHINMNNNIKLLTGYENFVFFADMEYLDSGYFFAGNIFAQLDSQYPNSKFILNTRDMEKWILSRLGHRDRNNVLYVERCGEFYSLSYDETIKKWREDWCDHHNAVISYFSNRKSDLLIYDIEKDDFGKIKEFFPELEFTVDKFPKTLNIKK